MDLFKKVGIGATAGSLITLALGILFCVNPIGSNKTIAIVFSILVIVAGIVSSLSYITQFGTAHASTMNLLIGILMILFGIFMLRNLDGIMTVLGIAFSVYIIIDGIKMLESASALKRYGSEKWEVSLIVSLLMILVGIVMFFSPFSSVRVIGFIIGITLIIDGISGLITVSSIKKYVKKADESNVVN